MITQRTHVTPALVTFYDNHPANGESLFFQPRNHMKPITRRSPIRLREQLT